MDKIFSKRPFHVALIAALVQRILAGSSRPRTALRAIFASRRTAAQFFFRFGFFEPSPSRKIRRFLPRITITVSKCGKPRRNLKVFFSASTCTSCRFRKSKIYFINLLFPGVLMHHSYFEDLLRKSSPPRGSCEQLVLRRFTA